MAAPLPPGMAGPSRGSDLPTEPRSPLRRALVPAALFAALAVVAVGLHARWEGGRTRKGPPNIILLVWDSARADRIGCYGADRPTTPNLDALAADGVRYENALAPAPWTAPSHASLFTGLLPTRHGLRLARGDPVSAGIPLLAETLKRAGYETVGISGNANISPLTGLSRGFEHYEGTYVDDDPSVRAERIEAATRRWLTARAAREHSGETRPVFLFVNLMSAHIPWAPRPECLDPVRRDEVPEGRLHLARAVNQRRALAHNLGIDPIPGPVIEAMRVLYDAGIRECDRTTGILLDALREAGLLNGALIAVTADHGENFGEHGLLEHRFSVNEALLRVPLVLRQEGRFQGGRVAKERRALQDLYPLFLGTAGVRAPRGTGVDATSLDAPPPPGRLHFADFAAPHAFVSNVVDGFGTLPPSSMAFMRTTLTAIYAPVDFEGRWKLVRRVMTDAKGASPVLVERLYDVEADPDESRDILAASPLPPGAARAAALLRATTPPPPVPREAGGPAASNGPR